jgi:hypothetical protein
MNKLNMFLIPHGTTIEQKSIPAATLIFSNTFSVNVMFRRKWYCVFTLIQIDKYVREKNNKTNHIDVAIWY